MLTTQVFPLIDVFVPLNERVLLAKAILFAQDIQEQSWDDKARKYSVDEAAAANKACKILEFDKLISDEQHRLILYRMVEYLNIYSWNESQGWAETLLKQYNQC